MDQRDTMQRTDDDDDEDVFEDAQEDLVPFPSSTASDVSGATRVPNDSEDEDDSPVSGASEGVLSPVSPASSASTAADVEDTGDTSWLADVPDALQAEADLAPDLAALKLPIRMFLNSEFRQSEALLQSKFKRSLYFTHGYATLMTLKAIMTFDANDMKTALRLLQTTVTLSGHYRKRDNSILGGLTGFMKGQSLESMTRLERHAELIFAESYLIKALLTIIHDESFLSFVKESFNVRSSYMTLGRCYKWLTKVGDAAGDTTKKASKKRAKEVDGNALPEFLPEDVADEDFVSGVCFGIGLFNLILAMLPDKLIKVFEMIGFAGSRQFGLQMLQHPRIGQGLRRFMCDMVVVAYNTILPIHVPFLDHDIALAERLNAESLQNHPNGAIYLYFAARIAFIKTETDKAIDYFQRSIASQSEWEQLHHICFWDLSQCYSIQMEYGRAADIMLRLAEKSRWSKAIYYYLSAVYRYTASELEQDRNTSTNISSSSSSSSFVAETLKTIQGRMQRIAGKRIPMEKFVSRKSRKYADQGNYLILPAVEMLMIRNGFAYMSAPNLRRYMAVIDARITDIQQKLKDGTSSALLPTRHYHDDLCLALLCRAIIQRELRLPLDSLDTFLQLLSHEDSVTLDHYIVPFGRYELAKLYLGMRPPMLKEARAELDAVKRDYKKYSLESNLHFRVHNAMHHVNVLERRVSVE